MSDSSRCTHVVFRNEESFKRLQQEVDQIKNENKGEISLVMRSKETSEIAICPIKSIVFEVGKSLASSTNGIPPYILAVLSVSDQVDVEALQLAIHEGGDVTIPTLQLAQQVASICGLEPGCVPPLIGLHPRPVCTVVDETLLANKKVMLEGGGGKADVACRLTVDILMRQPNVVSFQIARKPDQNALPSLSSFPQRFLESVQKPFFVVAPPDLSIVQSILDGTVHGTLEPIPMAVVGRISGIRRLTKGLVFGDLAPLYGTHSSLDHPWRSPLKGEDMAVQFIGGQTFVRNFGKAAEAKLKRLKVGMVVHLVGRTNVQNRDSLRNWMEKRSLDIVVESCEVLVDESEAPGKKMMYSLAKQPVSISPVSLSGQDVAGVSYLQLRDVYSLESESQEEGIRLVVDTVETIQQFAFDVAHLLLSISATSVEECVYRYSLVGIDCEWQPGFMAGGEQPVSLLQICLHSLKRIYLLDLQKLLRPMLQPSEEPTVVESTLRDCMSDLMECCQLVKVGFGLRDDLRLLAASFPHITSFQSAHCVLEVPYLARKVMQLSRQQNSKTVTASLSRLTEAFLGKPLSKEQQCSNWARRPLTREQINYAALDAAVTPAVVEHLLEVVGASVSTRPAIERWEGDKDFASILVSYRFLFLSDDQQNDASIRKLKARRMIGNRYVVTQCWIAGHPVPCLPSDQVGDGEPYTDRHGVMRCPAHNVMLQDIPTKLNALIGKQVSRSKVQCVDSFMSGSSSLPPEAELDYPPRSGWIEMQNAVLLFVSMPEGQNQKPRTYPNEWMDSGKRLSWFIQSNQWCGGSTRLAKKLLQVGDAVSVEVILFARSGKGLFVCCGYCSVSADKSISEPCNTWGLVSLELSLLQHSMLISSPDFLKLLQ